MSHPTFIRKSSFGFHKVQKIPTGRHLQEYSHFALSHVSLLSNFLSKFKHKISIFCSPRIDSKLNEVEEWLSDKQANVSPSQIDKDKTLRLCMYFIEAEFHFTGDGVWMENHQIDSTVPPNIPTLPQSLTKNYKYGAQPSTNSIAI